MANQSVDQDRNRLINARQHGRGPLLATFVRLSGPGWLQSALTLGGGSLGSSLYLGVLAGTSLLWLQPFAMVLGVIMLSAISYVALSTGERPFRLIRDHVNPVLAWSWVGAALLANIVWSMPQYSLCYAVFDQNLAPAFLGASPTSEATGLNPWAVSLVLLVLCTAVSWSYGSGHWGVKAYELLLKVVVALIVLSFLGVVLRMSWEDPGVDWNAVASGFVPNVNQLWKPSETFSPLLDSISSPESRSYWSSQIVSQQRDVMLSAGAAAVGINMTFLMPYSLLARGWDREFRGLAVFDLATGTFIPYVLATSAIVVVAAQQFHTVPPEGFVVEDGRLVTPERFAEPFKKMINVRTEAAPDRPVTLAEEQLASVLVRRDTYDLARSLQRLFGGAEDQGARFYSDVVFGAGVVGMTLSSISLMMVISGLVVCEVLGRPPGGWTFRLGCLASSTGALWPLFWAGGAKAWLTIVAGVIGAMLLPIAYVTFFVLMNRRDLLGQDAPEGSTRLVSNALMAIAAIAATAAGVSAIAKTAGWGGIAAAAGYVMLVVVVQYARPRNRKAVTS